MKGEGDFSAVLKAHDLSAGTLEAFRIRMGIKKKRSAARKKKERGPSG